MALVEGWVTCHARDILSRVPEAWQNALDMAPVPIKLFTPVTKSERSDLAGGRAFLGQFQSVVS